MPNGSIAIPSPPPALAVEPEAGGLAGVAAVASGEACLAPNASGLAAPGLVALAASPDVNAERKPPPPLKRLRVGIIQ